MKNLELKTKKMSLANIEGRLTPTEMENIMAGSMDWGAFCDGVAVAALFSLGTNPVLDAAGAACLMYAIHRR